MEPLELRPGLWTWTAPHPEAPSDGGWGPDVRSYASDAGDKFVVFDPIDPPPRVVELAAGRDLGVLLTCPWHRRSADALIERFGARVLDEPPVGVERVPSAYGEDSVYWIPRHNAVVVGDAVTAEGELRVRYDWLPPGGTREQMEAALRPLLELPVELILVTHGEPVTDGALEALRAALEA